MLADIPAISSNLVKPRNAPPPIKLLTLRMPKDILRQSTHRLFTMVEHVLFLMRAEAAVMVTVV